MNDLENKIKDALKKEVNKSFEYESAIKNAFKQRKNNKIRTPFFKVATTAGCLIMACTCVMAGSYITREKIWKEPIKVSQKEEENKVKEIITEEEKENIITEENAKVISNEIMQKLGYKNTIFKTVTLNRGYDSKMHYALRTEDKNNKGILINLNPKTGELEYFCDNDVINKNIKCDDITEENAKSIANDIYTKLDIINSGDGYEIMEVKRQAIASGSNVNDMWQVTYAKKNKDLFDKDTMFTTAFSVVDGETIIYIIKGKVDSNFENNPIVLSKEEAIQIATNKEKEFSSLEISSAEAELAIERMNIFIYRLENNIENNSSEYKVDDISRNVWKVEIKHKKNEKPKDTKIETVKQMYNKNYYIDATTGEIIGGEQAEFIN